MITVPALAAEALGSFLAARLKRRFGSTNASFVELIQSAAGLALDCIGNSDALYHNVEHTMLVTLVGYDIMKDDHYWSRHPQATTHIFSLPASFTRSVMFGAYSGEIVKRAILSMGVGAK
jgi:hypothetical protein